MDNVLDKKKDTIFVCNFNFYNFHSLIKQSEKNEVQSMDDLSQTIGKDHPFRLLKRCDLAQTKKPRIYSGLFLYNFMLERISRA